AARLDPRDPPAHRTARGQGRAPLRDLRPRRRRQPPRQLPRRRRPERGPGAAAHRGGARGPLPRARRAPRPPLPRAGHRPVEDEVHDARAVGVAHLVAEETEATVGSRESPESREDFPLIVDFGALKRRLTTGPRVSYDVPGHRRAAVLVPLLERNGETRILF